MKASEIRHRFLDYFQLRGHQLVRSASLVPSDDPSLLFTNAGMVPFKRVFLALDEPPHVRVVSAQKCVRAGGKHNDLEEVGRTARHHTFFEMLGNFSFGDYFKRDAVHFAWEFLTVDLGLDRERLFATVHYSDEEAFQLWQEVAGLDPSRVFQLGDADNFWQMANTGPCGPCSELHYDLRPSESRSVPSQEEFEALGESGEILELWNLVFMQFDRDNEGNLTPLPAPSIDTGAGLERLAVVLQGADSSYHTDLFLPLLERVADVVGRPYDPAGAEGVGFRVLADHSRAVAFLLADGVFPSNEGRGYVLRRVLRRGVRHAWLLGRRAPTLVGVVEEVLRVMGEAYPELLEREEHILKTTRIEEERFLSTIEGGMDRFDALAPPEGRGESRVIAGREAFKLYDTYGFPLDLTQIMAEERGYEVDEEGFHQALAEQRTRSRADREDSGDFSLDRKEGFESWLLLDPALDQEWVGWDATEADTSVVGVHREDGRAGLLLKENPFYAEAGGQVADVGVIEGEGWSLQVEEVRRIEERTTVFGSLEGELPEPPGEPLQVRARVDSATRKEIERNHTATHLLHAALRKVLGEHVTQRGSLVDPDRLRFDFSHPEPLTPEEIAAVEGEVNEAIWADHPVVWRITSREEASSQGAMALFGEKYGDEVRVVDIPGVSLELCGGTHLGHTGAAGLFAITRESGIASGVRRIEALTASRAYDHLRAAERELEGVAAQLKTLRENLPQRVEQLLREREELERLLSDLRRGGGGGERPVHEVEIPLSGGDPIRYRGLRMKVKDAEDARAFGDAFREEASMTVAALATESADGKGALFVFVTDDLLERGVNAGALVREIARVAGGRGGGRAHMAQGGIEHPEKVDEALRFGEDALRRVLEVGAA